MLGQATDKRINDGVLLVYYIFKNINLHGWRFKIKMKMDFSYNLAVVSFFVSKIYNLEFSRLVNITLWNFKICTCQEIL